MASPVAQGRGKRDAIVVGIDVSKGKLDIAVRPRGETFATSRAARGSKAASRASSLSEIALL
ncbi:MAG: hypothetical protein ACR2KT_08870 [Methylocella sp.]